MKRTLWLAAAIAIALDAHAAAPTIAPTPSIPTYGQAVGIDVQGLDVPVYLPGTRYSRSGNTITVDFEFLKLLDGNYGAFGLAFGAPKVDFGELAPGNYTVVARFIDMDHPGTVAQTTTTNVPVVPPQDWGVYSVPAQPLASDRVQMVVRSAVYFDPSTLKASVNGGDIRVEFAYHATAPVGGAVPPGMTSFASVDVGRLAPGTYHAEAWARPDTGGDLQRYFTLDFTVRAQSRVVEFYEPDLDHYFMAAGDEEVDLVDSGAQGGWKRTGQSFHAWLRKEYAPSNAQPVCRFYAKGPNSHFYTADPAECEWLKGLEQQGRADAAARGQPFLAWGYEGIAFYALVPVNGECPQGTSPVWRSYNARAAEDDSNHRFTADPMQHLAMTGWRDEGIAFCSPP
jgi:serine protease